MATRRPITVVSGVLQELAVADTFAVSGLSGTFAEFNTACTDADFVSTLTGYPVSKPTFLVDFVNSQSVDSRIVTTRSTGATRYNRKGLLELAAAGVPRINFDPTTLQCKGLLTENSVNNLYTYSSEFANAAWTKLNVTITSDATIAPDGTLTADKLVEDTALNLHTLYRNAALTAGSVYAESIFLKAGERTQCHLFFYVDTTYYGYKIDLLTGVVSANLVSGVTNASADAVVVSLVNGWFRCSLAKTMVGTTHQIQVRLYNNADVYTGDGVSGIYVWGSQLEPGVITTSYVYSTTTQGVRASDAFLMGGTDFTNWYRQDEGTFVVGFDIPATTTDAITRVIFGVSNGTFGNSMYLYRNTSSAGVIPAVITSSVSQSASVAGSMTANAHTIGTFAYKANNVTGTLNGGAAVTDSSATIPAAIQLVLGSAPWAAGSNAISGHIKYLAYYPAFIANATQQALSGQ